MTNSSAATFSQYYNNLAKVNLFSQSFLLQNVLQLKYLDAQSKYVYFLTIFNNSNFIPFIVDTWKRDQMFSQFST